MPTTDWFAAGSASNVDRDSKADWSNPGNATSEDGSNATCDVEKSTYGDWLYAYNFGFDGEGGVPSGATIEGIEMRLKCYRESGIGNTIQDSAVYLVDGDGSQTGDNQAQATSWPTSSPTWRTGYGGASDDWNATIDAADIRDSDFGVQISASNSDMASARMAYVDVVEIRVTYTAAPVLTAEQVNNYISLSWSES